MILPESLAKLVSFTKQISLELGKSSFTLDTGFDSQKNRELIREQKLKGRPGKAFEEEWATSHFAAGFKIPSKK